MEFTHAWESVEWLPLLALPPDGSTAFIGQPILVLIISLFCLSLRKSSGKKLKSDKWLALTAIAIWIAAGLMRLMTMQFIF